MHMSSEFTNVAVSVEGVLAAVKCFLSTPTISPSARSGTNAFTTALGQAKGLACLIIGVGMVLDEPFDVWDDPILDDDDRDAVFLEK